MKKKKAEVLIKNYLVFFRLLLFLAPLIALSFSIFFPPKTPIFAADNCSTRTNCSISDYPYCVPNVNFNDCGGLSRCWDGNITESLIGDCTYVYDPNRPTPTPAPFTETGNNCTNRRGNCPEDIYPECTEDVNYQNCSGPNFCKIPHYIPMGTVNPYNLVSCASKTFAPPPSEPIGSPSNCPVCSEGFIWNSGYQTCQKTTYSGVKYEDPDIIDCSSSTNKCYPGYGCNPSGNYLGSYKICDTVKEENIEACKGCINGGGAWTALGCVPTEPTELVKWIFPYLLGFGGLAAFLLIVFAGIQIMTSSGNPEKLKAGKELITSAITGLIFIILSLFLLRVIGVDILHIPGLK